VIEIWYVLTSLVFLWNTVIESGFFYIYLINTHGFYLFLFDLPELPIPNRHLIFL